MKKLFILVLMSGLSFGLLAQTSTTTTTTTTTDGPVLKSKKGENYLPEADEWGLGVSADPFLTYVGNFLNFAGNTPPTFNYSKAPGNGFSLTDRIAIFGKKMVDANTAYRLRVNLDLSKRTDDAVVSKDVTTPDPLNPKFGSDKRKTGNTGIVIAAGLEKRRGSTRLQGVYGAEAIIGFSQSSVKYDYENSYSTDFPTPNTTDFGGNKPTATSRVTESKSGSNLLVGARGFVGVEYFIMPKISLGAEFGLLLAFQAQKNGKETTESFDGTNVNKVKTEVDNAGINYVGIGMDNLSGSINLLFYF